MLGGGYQLLTFLIEKPILLIALYMVWKSFENHKGGDS